MNGNKGEDISRGPGVQPDPREPIKTGGPPHGPPDEKLVITVLVELERRQAAARKELANATLVLNEVEKKLKEIRKSLDNPED